MQAIRDWLSIHPMAASGLAALALLLMAWIGDRIAKRFLFAAIRKLGA